MADFSNYELAPGFNVYELADGLLPEIAHATGYELDNAPTEETLRGLVGHIGPAKTLQDNIAGVQEKLDTTDDATTIAADWVERSGVLIPLSRAFKNNEPVPETVDNIVMGGGVANWMLRRRNLIERLDPDQADRVVIPVGNREMKETEHNLVKTFALSEGHLPTEAEFAQAFVLGTLGIAGFAVDLVPVDNGQGDAVLDEAIAHEPGLLYGKVLVVGNAPSVVQSAGQFREAAKRVDPNFDSADPQLFMMGDTIPVARRGEGTATHQNPFSALGQIARNALYLS